MDYSPPGYSVHGIFQARILEWVAISFSRGSSQPWIKPGSPTLQADSLSSEPPEKHQNIKSGVVEKGVLWISKDTFITLCCCCSVTQSCLTLFHPMDCSTPGSPVLHYLPKFAQTHVHWVSDAIQPFHPLSSPSPPAFNLSQYHGLFQWVSSSHQVAKVLELQL